MSSIIFIRKVLVPIFIVLYLFEFWGVRSVVLGLLGMFTISALGIAGYLRQIKEWNFPRIDLSFIRPRWKKMGNYSLYGIGTGLAVVATTNIDTIMVASLIDLESTGAYSIALFIANALAAPLLAIGAISGPVIAEAWNRNAGQEINRLFQSSSSLLFFIGTTLYAMILVSLRDLLDLLPSDTNLSDLYWVFLFLGLSQIMNMLGSVSHQIVHYSNRYQFNLMASLSLAVINIILNLLFVVIYDMGIIGVSIATSISVFLFNSIRILFIYANFKMHPFKRAQFGFGVFGLFCILLITTIPISAGPIGSIAVRSFVLLLLFLGYNQWRRFVPEVNQYIDMIWAKVMK